MAGWLDGDFNFDIGDAVGRARAYVDDGGVAPLTGFKPSTIGLGTLGGVAAGNTQAEAEMASTALDGAARQAIAERQADTYLQLAKMQNEATAKAQQGQRQGSNRRGSSIGGIANIAGTVASFIPGVGPLVGGAVKAIGGLFG